MISIFCLCYSLYIAIFYANQIPLDLHLFRQTQTALTTYWLVQNSFNFAYETPVVGYPWSIPFEFPIYEYIVALIHQIFQTPLNATGRVISYIFLILCLFPIRSITERLEFSDTIFYIFSAIFLSSPIYLYWGRTFMIETCALFFTVTAIKYFLDILLIEKSLKNFLFFMIFMSLSLLQKITTGLPVLVVMVCLYFSFIVNKNTSIKNLINKDNLFLTISIIIPFAISFFWTVYTDQIKMQNPIGVGLTSTALRNWNFGTLEQKLSINFYQNILWERIFNLNLSGMLGLAILISSLIITDISKKVKILVIISFILGLSPLFIFTNLHINHDYYQVATVVFLIYAVAVCLHEGLKKIANNMLLSTLVFLMVLSNYANFYKYYLESITKNFDKNSLELAVGLVIKEYVPENKYFVAFGNDWSSSFAYLSERKSFTVPIWFKHYKEIMFHPEHFIDMLHLGAVVLCPNKNTQTISDLEKWSVEKNWKIGNVSGCFISIPEHKISHISNISNTQCQGAIDEITPITNYNQDKNIFHIRGWTTISGEKSIVPEKTYISLTKQGEQPIYFEAIQNYRSDVNQFFKQSDKMNAGFSRVINIKSLSGIYTVDVVMLYQNHFQACHFNKIISLNEKT